MPGSYVRFDTESDYRASVEQVLGEAAASVRILDRDLAPMKLESPRVSALIAARFRANRAFTIHIALHDTDFVARDAPRLLDILELHLGQFEIRLVPESLRELSDCHLLADAKHGVRRFHKDFPRGALFLDNPAETAPWWKRFDELWAACTPASLARRTGL